MSIPASPSTYSNDEERVLALLDADIVNLGPIVKAVYPDTLHSTASAKFSAKRLRKRYQKFLPAEMQLIRQALATQLEPVIALYSALEPLSVFPPDAKREQTGG